MTPPWLVGAASRYSQRNTITKATTEAKGHGDLVRICTGGSQRDRLVACAVVCIDAGCEIMFTPLEIPIDDDTLFFETKLYALHTALEQVEETNWQNCQTSTDSPAVILALSSAKALSQSTVVAKTMRKSFDLFDQRKCITLAWVPCHAGVPGKEFADKTAEQAITHPVVDHSNSLSFGPV